MGIEFMFVKIIWPQGVVYPCFRVYMIMYFKHLCNHLANQNKTSYVAFLQRENEYLFISDPGHSDNGCQGYKYQNPLKIFSKARRPMNLNLT